MDYLYLNSNDLFENYIFIDLYLNFYNFSEPIYFINSDYIFYNDNIFWINKHRFKNFNYFQIMPKNSYVWEIYWNEVFFFSNPTKYMHLYETRRAFLIRPTYDVIKSLPTSFFEITEYDEYLFTFDLFYIYPWNILVVLWIKSWYFLYLLTGGYLDGTAFFKLVFLLGVLDSNDDYLYIKNDYYILYNYYLPLNISLKSYNYFLFSGEPLLSLLFPFFFIDFYFNKLLINFLIFIFYFFFFFYLNSLLFFLFYNFLYYTVKDSNIIIYIYMCSYIQEGFFSICNICNPYYFHYVEQLKRARLHCNEIFHYTFGLYSKYKGSSSLYFYLHQVINKAYTSYMLILIISLLGRIFYTTIIFIFYNIYIFFMRYLYQSLYFFNFYYLIMYLCIYIKVYISRYINFFYISRFWYFYYYIKLEFFTFMHQLEATSMFLFSIADFIVWKRLKLLDIHSSCKGAKPYFSKNILKIIYFLLPLIQNYKNKFNIINIKFVIYLLINIIINNIINILFIILNLIKRFNNKFNYFILLCELSLLNKKINSHKYKYFIILIILLFIINSKILFFIILLLIIYLIIKLYSMFQIYKYINKFIYLYNFFFLFIGFLFYSIYKILYRIFFFIYRIFFFIIYKLKFFIFLYLLYYSLGFDISFIFLLFKEGVNYMCFSLINEIFASNYYNYFYLLLWEKLLVDTPATWVIKAQDIHLCWLNWVDAPWFEGFHIYKHIWVTIININISNIWNFLGPFKLLGFFLELKIPTLCYFYILWLLRYIYSFFFFNLTPFLFLQPDSYFFLFYIWKLYKILILIYKYIYIYFVYLYFYIIPYYFSLFYSPKIFFILSFYFSIKYYIFYYIFSFIIKLLLLINFYILNLKNCNFLIGVIIKIWMSINFNVFSNIFMFIIKFIIMISFDSFFILKIWLYWYFNNLNKYYMNFYIFINYWYEMQSNLDLITSYFRISRYKFKKFVHKFIYASEYLDDMMAESMYTGHIQSVTLPYPCNTLFKYDHNVILHNLNILIKFWKFHYHKRCYDSTASLIIINKYTYFILREFTGLYIFIYIFCFICFRFWYKIYNKDNYHNNAEFLWYNIRSSFKKKVFDKKNFNLLLKKKWVPSSYFNQKNIGNKNQFIIDWFFTSMNAHAINEKIFIKKLLFLKFINKKFITNKVFNKILLNTLFVKFKKRNTKLYKYLISSYKFSFFYLNVNKYYKLFEIFFACMFKTNKYAKYLFIQKLNIVEEYVDYPESSKHFNYNNFGGEHNNLLNKIIKYFYLIDKKIFNNSSPDWLLHKNKTTFFFTNPNPKTNNITVCYDLPFETDFFFLILVTHFWIAYYIILGLSEEILISGLYNQRDFFWFLYIILGSFNNDFFWFLFITYFNFFEQNTAGEYLQNVISNGGMENLYKKIHTIKFNFVDVFLKYKRLHDLKYNFFNFNFFNIYINSKILWLFYIKSILILLILYYIYSFFFIDLKLFKLRFKDYKLLNVIYLHYKCNLLSLKNYLIKIKF